MKGHSVIFTTRYRGVPMHVVERTIAPLSEDTVLVLSTVKMDDYTAQDGKRMTDNLFRLTWVLKKQEGKWLIRFGQNTVIDQEAARHNPVK